MKPIYKSLVIEAAILSISLSLQAQVTSGETVATQDVQAESLEGLKVVLISPNVSGAKDLIESGECELDGANLLINLNNLTQGVHRVQVSAVFGTQTVVLYAIDLTVPVGRLSDETQEFEDEVIVVSTYGDGDVSGADASVYAKDGDGNAHITKPLSIGDGVASGDGAVASGYANDEGTSIQASGVGAVANGCAYGGASIQATINGAVASGCVDGEGAIIQADAAGAVASGYAEGKGAIIQADSAGAVASGYAEGDGAIIQATGGGAVASGSASGGASIQTTSNGAVASGYAEGEGASIQATGEGSIVAGYANDTYGNVAAQGVGSQAFGLGTQAAQDAQMVCGQCNVVDGDDTFQFIVGNGADDEHRSNGFAVTKSGELALFKADGTPIYLDASKLEALIATLPTT